MRKRKGGGMPDQLEDPELRCPRRLAELTFLINAREETMIGRVSFYYQVARGWLDNFRLFTIALD